MYSRIPIQIHFNENLRILSLGFLPESLVLQFVPLPLSVLHSEQRNEDPAQELVLVVLVLVVDTYLHHVVNVSHVALSNVRTYEMDKKLNFLQRENLLPDWSESFILRVSLEPVVDDLHHCEGVALTTEIRRVKTLGFYDLQDKMTHVLHVEEGVCYFLRKSCLIFAFVLELLHIDR